MLSAKLSLFYFFYFALLGVMAPYMGLYLEAKGFSLLEIAELVSLLMLTKIVAPNLWGIWADHTQRRIRLVRYGAFTTLICFLFFFFAESFWHYALVIVCFSFFWNAILPQFEVITLFNLADQKERYSRIRLWGSIGFILSVVLAGWLFDKAGIGQFSYVLLLIVLAIWMASLFHFSEPFVAKEDGGEGPSFVEQLSFSPVAIFFLVCFLLQLSHGAYYTYFSIFLEDIGYGKTQIGLLWGLGVVAEVALFVVMHRWFARHALKTILFVALVLTSIRWFLIAEWASVLWLLLIAQLLHAMSFGAMHAASIHFVHRVFHEQNQGRAQALYSSVGFGAGGALGAYISGVVVSAYGYSTAFLMSALIAFLASILVVTQDYEKNLPEIG